MNLKERKEKIEKLKKELKELEAMNLFHCEGMCIINTKTSLKNYNNAKTKIQELIEIDDTFDEIGIKKLAYEIQKQKEGFYLSFKFYGTNDDIQNLERYYRSNHIFLKFINIKMEA